MHTFRQSCIFTLWKSSNQISQVLNNATTGISLFFCQQRIPSQHLCMPWPRLSLIHSQTLHILNSKRPFLQLKLNTQLQLTIDGSWHRNSMLEIKCSSSQITFVPLGPRKNFQRSSLVPLPSLPKLVLTRSPFIYQRACILSTQFSTSPWSNLQLRIPSLVGTPFLTLRSSLMGNQNMKYPQSLTPW